MKALFLLPGDIAVENDPAQLATILGSCVAVAIYDARTKRTGLNHYLLPGPGEAGGAGRYGVTAIPELIRRFLRAGSNSSDLVAKVYGGANVLDGVVNRIGELNIEIARISLGENGIPILEERVGGLRGRRIVVFSSDFTVVDTEMRSGGAA